jgi:adenylosuccinate lyase
VRSNAIAAMENIPLWHERDISHSSVERIIIPDSTILVDYMLARLTGILKDLRVYPERMLENIGRSYGLFFSQKVMLRLTEKGMSREKAYALVQENAMKSWHEKKDFKEMLKKDTAFKEYLSDKELGGIFNLKDYTKNVNYIFRRVFK